METRKILSVVIQFSRCLIVLTLAISLGAHWMLLQSLAWGGMIFSYSRDTTLAEAVNKTFDGKHPCSLCLIVKQGRDAEKKQEQQRVGSAYKLELGLIWSSASFHLPLTSVSEQISLADASPSSRSEGPPKPRPRSFVI